MMLEQTNLTLPTTLQDVITRAASQHTQQNTQVVSIVLSFGFFASSWPERFIKLKKQRNRMQSENTGKLGNEACKNTVAHHLTRGRFPEN